MEVLKELEAGQGGILRLGVLLSEHGYDSHSQDQLLSGKIRTISEHPFLWPKYENLGDSVRIP